VTVNNNIILGYNGTKYSVINNVIIQFDYSSFFRHFPAFWSVGPEGLFSEVKAVGGVSLITHPI